MSVPAYMLSIVKRQIQKVGEGKFLAEFPQDWLIWEPGPWRPVKTTSDLDIRSTVGPAEGSARPAGEDSFCFHLTCAEGGSLKVGRATTNDVVINDLTSSREQFMLQREGGQWFVVSLGAALTVAGAAVNDHQRVGPFTETTTIEFGSVRLSLTPSRALLARLTAP